MQIPKIANLLLQNFFARNRGSSTGESDELSEGLARIEYPLLTRPVELPVR